MRAVLWTASALAVLAVALWLGGLLVLGAIVAPTVFGHVSFPQSADAMTLVFRRFDAVAMTCAAVALAAEATRAGLGRSSRTGDRVRALGTAVAAALAAYQGTSLSPRIAAIHASGAVRGVGAAGVELSRLHDLSEACGKAEVALLVAVLLLGIATRAPIRAAAPPVA